MPLILGCGSPLRGDEAVGMANFRLANRYIRRVHG